MSYSHVIVVREPGKTIAKAYAEKLLADAVAFGMATVKNGKMEIEREKFDKDNPIYTVEEFEAGQQDTLDCRSVYIVLKSKDTINDTSLQPFEAVFDANNNLVMALFLEGDFPSYTMVESTDTDEFHAATKFIIPTLKKLYTQASTSDKMDGVIVELADDLTKQNLTNAIGPRGVITMLTNNHGATTLEKNSGGSQFPWGWVSDTLKYTEQPAATTAPVESARTFGRKRPVIIAESSNKGVLGGKPAATPVPNDIDAAKEQHLENVEDELEMVAAPDALSGNKRKSWYQLNCTIIPANWWERGAKAPMQPNRKGAVLKALGALPKPAAEIKVTSEHVAAPAVGPAEPAEAGPLVFEVEEVKRHIVTLDRNNKPLINDPKQFQALETKDTTFFQDLGEGEDYLDLKTKSWFVELCKLVINNDEIAKPHEVLAKIMFNLRNQKMMALDELDLATTPSIEVKTPAQDKPAVVIPTRRRHVG